MTTTNPSFKLQGLWAAMPTPWNSRGGLDPGALAANVARLAAARVDGVYTTDSDGEFYAIEAAEFHRIAQTLATSARKYRVPAAMGVTWTNTAGIMERTRMSVEAGIPLVHVAYPYFMELTAGDVRDFWNDLARAAPKARWIHYAHPRCGPAMKASDYQWLAQQFPRQFVGTKLVTADALVLAELIRSTPQVAHFVGDRTMAAGYWLGAAGCYSYWVNTLPAWMRKYCDVCVSGDWSSARRHFDKLEEWERTAIQPLREKNHRHAVLGKARAALTGWLQDNGHIQPPYHPIGAQELDQLRTKFRAYWREELALETFPSPARRPRSRARGEKQNNPE